MVIQMSIKKPLKKLMTLKPNLWLPISRFTRNKLDVSILTKSKNLNGTSKQKIPGPDRFIGEFYQMFECQLSTISTKDRSRERIFFNSFHEIASLMLKNRQPLLKKYRPKSLMNIDAKNLNKIWENWIKITRELYTTTKWDLSQICKADSILKY